MEWTSDEIEYKMNKGAGFVSPQINELTLPEGPETGMKYVLAILACFVIVVLDVFILLALGMKPPGGAIPAVILFIILSLTWRGITKSTAPKNPDYDVSQWDVIKNYDKSAATVLTRIQPLGEPWVDDFIKRVMDCDPKVRNVDAIAEQVLLEYAKSLRISENETINAAYSEVKNKYGTAGAQHFKRIYDLVGDAMDIEKATTEIENAALQAQLLPTDVVAAQRKLEQIKRGLG